MTVKKPIFVLLLILLLFLLIVFLVGNENLFLFINQEISNRFLDFFVLYILTPFLLLLGIVPLVMLFFKKYRGLGFFALCSGFICSESGHFLKYLFSFPRPYEILDARILGPWHLSEFSFPSSTTMLAFGLALPFILRKTRLGFPFLGLASLAGFSVIYTGFHFPQDVAGGVFFSILIVSLLNKIKNYAQNWHHRPAKSG